MFILDIAVRRLIQYFYDAWGNFKTSVLDETHAAIARLNPFRYRGYYYDTETNLYYLNTRYYDPEVGRFVSQDDVSYLDPEHVNGLNLFAYCGNNPVMMTDETGTMPKWLRWLLGIVIIVAAVVVSVATAGLATPISTALGGGFAGSIIGGAVAGAVSGAIASFGISVGMQGIEKGFENIDWNEVENATLRGCISGAISGGFFGGIKFVASADKLANSVSGLSKAKEGLNKAKITLDKTGLAIKGGSLTTERISAQLAYNAASECLGIAKTANKVFVAIFKGAYSLAQFGLKSLFNYLSGGFIHV